MPDSISFSLFICSSLLEQHLCTDSSSLPALLLTSCPWCFVTVSEHAANVFVAYQEVSDCITKLCCPIVVMQVFDGDMAYLHQTGVIAKNQDSSLDGWARDYFLASEADRCPASPPLPPPAPHDAQCCQLLSFN